VNNHLCHSGKVRNPISQRVAVQPGWHRPLPGLRFHYPINPHGAKGGKYPAPKATHTGTTGTLRKDAVDSSSDGVAFHFISRKSIEKATQMKRILAMLIASYLLSLAILCQAQDPATEVAKDTKTAAAETGHASKKAADKTADMSKDTAKETKKAGTKTTNVTKDVGNDTGKAAQKTGHGVKKGVKGVGHVFHKGSSETEGAPK
jgi:poly-gamma-glutamate capsule biosynthesis protein CapA/YwtB (metallophosphatase superfamily)